MSFCFSFSKLILFVLNFLFVLIGLIIFAAGVWTAADSASILETIAFFSKTQSTVLQLYANTEFIYICGWILIAIGALVFILAFVGCWVVVSENRILLIVYTTFMCLVVLFEVIVVILLLALKSTHVVCASRERSVVLAILTIWLLCFTPAILFCIPWQWEPKVAAAMSEIFSENYVGTMGAFNVSEYDPFSLAADSFMIQFSCCGINGPNDFKSSDVTRKWHMQGRKYEKYAGDQVALPVACCKFENTKFFVNQQYADYQYSMVNTKCPVQPPTDFNQVACRDVIPVELDKHKLPLILAPVIFLTLEVIYYRCTCLEFFAELSNTMFNWLYFSI
ncbi:Tetraspanin-1 [Fasciolopsis buskii]|uniref:Tetraspanin-1 n=1 Tax=Fasciolopsis buskii TaxID=27845 RepID=A0A8E0S278_9TREM|nr:Tetraspanin-1 [Fasciolopsis buski]